MSFRRRRSVASVAALSLLGILHCAGTSDDEAEAVGASRQAIVGGSIVDAPLSPVLYVVTPQGSCTAVLVAPNLAVTARHCVAKSTGTGALVCTPSGEPEDGSTGGDLGKDLAPGSVAFFSSEEVANHHAVFPGDTPEAVGKVIISTDTPTVCRDDLAFVVLSKPIPALIPAPIRLGPTQANEPVRVMGYGFTQTTGAPLALRESRGAQIVGIGPVDGGTATELAPLRSVRVGPATTTCNGDSGGPIQSTDGELIAVLSIGEQQTGALSCPENPHNADGTGPLLADYASLIDEAFAAAGETAPELDASADASNDSGSKHDSGGTTHKKDSGDPSGLPVDYSTVTACATRPGTTGFPVGYGSAVVPLATAVLAIGRRRRRS